jgi:hypothetical protein
MFSAVFNECNSMIVLLLVYLYPYFFDNKDDFSKDIFFCPFSLGMLPSFLKLVALGQLAVGVEESPSAR